MKSFQTIIVVALCLAVAGCKATNNHNNTDAGRTDAGASDAGTISGGDAATHTDSAVLENDAATVGSDGSTDANIQMSDLGTTTEMDAAMPPMDASIASDASATVDSSAVVDAGVDDGSVDAALSPIAIEDFPAALARVVCTNLCNSSGNSDTAMTVAMIAGAADCVDFVTTLAKTQFLGEDLTAYSALRESYDANAAAACIASIAASCLDISEGPASIACASIFVGTGVTGSACVRDKECESGYLCNNGGTDQCGLPLGQCMPTTPLGLGDACAGSGTTCSDPAYGNVVCDYVSTAESSFCKAHVVGLLNVDEGQPCGARETTANVVATDYCAAGLYCDGDTHLCTVRVADGLGCAEILQPCALDHTCSLLPDASLYTCNSLGLGDPTNGCSSSQPCDPAQELSCVPTIPATGGDPSVGTCQHVGAGNLGDICPQGGYQVLLNGACQTGMYCDWTAHCVTLRAFGEPCGSNTDCVSGTCNVSDGDGGYTCGTPFCGGG